MFRQPSFDRLESRLQPEKDRLKPGLQRVNPGLARPSFSPRPGLTSQFPRLIGRDRTSPRSRVSPGWSTTRSITTPKPPFGGLLADRVAGILLAGDQALDVEAAFCIGLEVEGKIRGPGRPCSPASRT